MSAPRPCNRFVGAQKQALSLATRHYYLISAGRIDACLARCHALKTLPHRAREREVVEIRDRPSNGFGITSIYSWGCIHRFKDKLTIILGVFNKRHPSIVDLLSDFKVDSRRQRSPMTDRLR